MVAENLDHESRCRCINTSDILKPRDLPRWPYVSDAEEQSHSPEMLGAGGGKQRLPSGKKTVMGSWR